MTLASGTKLGRYEIRSLIGAGGMGEVYLARDPRIGRDVAIKVLPTNLTDDKERLARFEQEAQAAGSLNHPNILAIYDVDAHDGSPYVVSELLEGHTLRQRLDDGDITQRKALDYGVQIADGLAAAHEKGIVHRDLKPENLFVTGDERVKILDFGLAKLLQKDGDAEALSDAPTRKVNTDAGTVMGTVGYMSPEQVRGGKIDHRTDLFSFGTILYEMLSGKPAFRGETGVETLNSILKEDPPELSEVSGKTVSPALESIVRHCLEKKPDRRFQSANDVAFALEAFSHGSGSAATVIGTSISPPQSRERIFWFAACAMLLLTALAALAYAFLRPTASTQQSRLGLRLPPSFSGASEIVVSPDGQRVVFKGSDGEGHVSLWLRPLSSLDARKLDGTDQPNYPFWSPDNRHIGYSSGGKLYIVDTEGGRPQAICDAEPDGGATWNRDNVIIFGGGQGLYRVNATGGKPVLVTKINEKEEAHRWPYFLPDGKHFVFLGDAGRAEDHSVRLGSLDSEDTQVLFTTVFSRIAYAAPGYLLFVHHGSLQAQKFDAASGKISGEPVVVADQILEVGGNHEFDFSVSDNGELVYQTGNHNSNLTWYDRTGKELESFPEAGDFTQVSLCSDGHRVITSVTDADGRNGDLWLLDFARKSKQRLTFDPLDEVMPAVSPDCSRIVYTSSRKGVELSGLFMVTVDSLKDEELVTEPQTSLENASWSPDGRYLLFDQCPFTRGCSLSTLSMEGSREPRQYLQPSPFDQYQGRISPDGKWAAYVSTESGRVEVYVQSFPGPGKKHQVTTNGGSLPMWSRDGRELIYMALGGKLMSVPVRSGTTFDSDPPAELFQTNAKPIGYGSPFAPSADGQKLLVNTPIIPPGGPNFVVVQNWAAGLSR